VLLLNSSDLFRPFITSEPLAVELISKAINSKKIAHAYIFSGKNHQNLIELVQVFAKLLLCESLNGMDNCQNCQVFEHNQHPDYRIWQPEGEKNKSLKLAQVKDLISVNQKKPITSKHQVLVLDQINLLSREGCNALLKTLEEPAKYATIIITVDSFDNVLPTIISRCQLIQLKTEEEKKEKAVSEEIIPNSYSQAANFAKEYETKTKEELIDFLKSIQHYLWERVKNDYSEQLFFEQKIEVIAKIEDYLKYLDGYVNQKLILDNFFVLLFENRKFFITK